MGRSIKKGPFVDDHLMRKVEQAQETGSRKVIKTWSRRSDILPEMVGLSFAVHNGNKFIPRVFTDQDLLRSCLGQEGTVGQKDQEEQDSGVTRWKQLPSQNIFAFHRKRRVWSLMSSGA